MVEEEKVKRILGELMKEAFRDELLDAYLNGKEVAICLTPRGLEKFEGEKNKVEIPNDAEFCIHTHFYSEEFSPADLKVAKKLPVCTYYVGPENGQEKVKCIYNNELLALAEEYPEIKEVLERTQDWFNAEYNLREIVKQLILLEDHYLKARCSDCITKHLLTIEGYAEEGAKLRNGDKYLDLFNEVHDLALKHLEIVHTSIHEDKAVNVYDMLQEVRELRKKIMYKLFNIEPELNESVKQEVIPDQWRWSELKPKTKAEREELLKKFGARCFLGPKSLKFPICAYPSGAISCDGLRAAYVRARSLMGATKDRHPELYKYSKIAERALELAKKFGCEWVKGHEEVREGEEFFRELEEELEEQSPIRWTGGKRYLVKTLKQ